MEPIELAEKLRSIVRDAEKKAARTIRGDCLVSTELSRDINACCPWVRLYLGDGFAEEIESSYKAINALENKCCKLYLERNKEHSDATDDEVILAIAWSGFAVSYGVRLYQIADILEQQNEPGTTESPAFKPTDTHRVILDLVKNLGPGRVKKAELAEKLGYTHPSSLDKPLAELVRAGVLDSTSGSAGGYSLS